MTKVHILHHVMREFEDDEDVKLIGVYQSEDGAQAAIERLSEQPGFCDNRGGFQVNPYELDQDHWTQGFVTEMYNVDD